MIVINLDSPTVFGTIADAEQALRALFADVTLEERHRTIFDQCRARVGYRVNVLARNPDVLIGYDDVGVPITIKHGVVARADEAQIEVIHMVPWQVWRGSWTIVER